MASSISDGPLLPGESTEADPPRWAALGGLIVVLAATTLVGALHPSLPKLGGTPAPYAIGDPGLGSLGAILPPTNAPAPTPQAGTAARPPVVVVVARRGAVAKKARTPAAPAPRPIRRATPAAPITGTPVERVAVGRSTIVRTPVVPAPVVRAPRAPAAPAPVALRPVVRIPVVTRPVPAPVVPAPVEPEPIVPAPIGQAPIVPVPTITSAVVRTTVRGKIKGTSGEPQQNTSGRSAGHADHGKGSKHRG